MFRLQDQWFYFLRGETIEFSEFKRYLRQPLPIIAGTYVSVVVNQTGQDYLYKGFLWDFHLNKEGELDRLVLHHTIRSVFGPSGEKAQANGDVPKYPESANENAGLIISGNFQYQSVTSQLFTVRYSECKTLACTYFYLKEIPQ